MRATLSDELYSLYRANAEYQLAKSEYQEWLNECAPYISLSESSRLSHFQQIWTDAPQMQDKSAIPDFEIAKEAVPLARAAVKESKKEFSTVEQIVKELEEPTEPEKTYEEYADTKGWEEFLASMESGLNEWIQEKRKFLIDDYQRKWNEGFYEEPSLLKKMLNLNNKETREKKEHRRSIEELLKKMNDCASSRDIEGLEELDPRHFTYHFKFRGKRYNLENTTLNRVRREMPYCTRAEFEERRRGHELRRKKLDERLRSISSELMLDYDSVGSRGIIEELKQRIAVKNEALKQTVITAQQAWMECAKTKELLKKSSIAYYKRERAASLSTGETVPEGRIDQILQIEEKIRSGVADNLKEALVLLDSESLENARHEENLRVMAEHNAAMQELERSRNDEIRKHNELLRSYREEELEELREYNSAMITHEQERFDEECASNQRMYELKERETHAQQEAARAIQDQAQAYEADRQSIYEDNIKKCSNCAHLPSISFGPDTFCSVGGCKLANSGQCLRYLYAG